MQGTLHLDLQVAYALSGMMSVTGPRALCLVVFALLVLCLLQQWQYQSFIILNVQAFGSP